MRPIQRSEIQEAAAYERVRADMRRAVIDLKRRRRIQAGPRITLVFHSRETLLYQLQERLRAERVDEDAATIREIPIVNEILPAPGGLSAELYIEIADRAKIREEMERFAGLDRGEHLWFDLGDAGKSVARFSHDPEVTADWACVHSVQFLLGQAGARWFRDPAKEVVLFVEHPGYTASVPVEGTVRSALAEDLEEA